MVVGLSLHEDAGGVRENVGAAYHKVSPRFWIDEKRIEWSDDATLLALYLQTCPHRRTEGLYRLPKQYVVADLNWSAERLAEPFAQLLRDRFISYDDRVSVVLLRNALKYSPPENPNQDTSAIRAIEELPETPLLQEFIQLAERFTERFAKRLAERFGQPLTLTQAQPQPLTLSSEIPAPDLPNLKRERKGQPYTPEFEQFWAIYPRTTGKQAAFRAWQTKLRNGVTAERLIQTAKHYAVDCQQEGRPEKFIKHGATFLGPDDHWRDYLESPKPKTTTGASRKAPDSNVILRREKKDETDYDYIYRKFEGGDGT